MKLSWSTGVVVALATISEAVPAPIDSRALPLVQSNQLRRIIYRSEILKKANLFQEFAYSHEGRNRVIGSPGLNKTINYLYDTLVATGYYDVSFQEFSVPSAEADLTVNGASIETAPMTFTSEGEGVTGNLVKVANLGCVATDYPATVSGTIALISRGECSFQIKATLAKAAGAIGTVIYNNVANTLLQGTLGEAGDYAPTVGITLEAGQAFVAGLEAGTPQAAVLNVDLSEVITWNVIAETKAGDHDNVLVVGAHSDSVAEGPGINDNGSGSIGILEVALQLTKFSTNNAIRFAWWSAEEEGLIGATEYVASLSQEEQDKIRLYINFDMIASPNFVYEIYDGDGSAFGISGPPGSAEVEKLWETYFPKDAQLPYNPSAFDGRSDYGPFLDAGIAAGGLTSGADGVKTEEEVTRFGGTAGIIYDPNYHTARDVVRNTNMGAWSQITKGIAHAVATYGRSFDGFPRRTKRDLETREVHQFQRKGGKFVY